MKARKLYPDDGLPDIAVTSTSGHCMQIGKDWVTVPPPLEQKVRETGNVEFDNSIQSNTEHETQRSGNAVNQDDEHALRVKAIKHLLTTNSADDFTGDGVPKVAAVNREAGFSSTKSEVLEAWAVVQDEAGAGE